MNKLIVTFLIVFLGLGLALQAQIQPEEGSVSYITSQNVYVKFQSTQNIQVGDTLFIKQDDKMVPVLAVESLSSISCVCKRISDLELVVSSTVLTKGKMLPADEETQADSVALISVVPMPEVRTDTAEASTELIKPEQLISGRFSISSYSSFSNTTAANSQKMRYTASFNMKNISNTNLSLESYISFVHNDQYWDEIKENVFNGLKIYNLSLNYDFNKSTRLLLGRKINPKLSSMGAIDGLQFEKKFKLLSLGVVAGFKPDYQDYSLDLNLFQVGAYISHDYVKGRGTMQSTFAFIQQMNSWKTDRRFIYLQHYNTLVKNLFFMGTLEVDLYEKIDSIQSGTFSLTNLYLSLRYRVLKQLSFTVSYNARQNIIYYETYKSIIDQLLDDEMLQGFRFQVNASPFRNFSLGITAGYRYRPDDPSPSKNLYAYATYTRVPVLNASATASFTLLETGYVSGKIYSLGLTKDLVPGKLSSGINYRYVDYSFYNAESTLAQNLAEINLMWRIMRKLSVSVYYEGTFEKVNSYNRVYINLSQRI